MSWELDKVERWMVSALETAVDHTRVYNSFRAAREAHGSAGFIVFRLVPGVRSDVRVQGPQRIMVRPTYDVTVITKGSPTDASEAMVSAMDDALNIGEPVSFEEMLISCTRLNPLSYESPGLIPEEFFVYRGGTYQLWIT